MGGGRVVSETLGLGRVVAEGANGPEEGAWWGVFCALGPESGRPRPRLFPRWE